MLKAAECKSFTTHGSQIRLTLNLYSYMWFDDKNFRWNYVKFVYKKNAISIF